MRRIKRYHIFGQKFYVYFIKNRHFAFFKKKFTWIWVIFEWIEPYWKTAVLKLVNWNFRFAHFSALFLPNICRTHFCEHFSELIVFQTGINYHIITFLLTGSRPEVGQLTIIKTHRLWPQSYKNDFKVRSNVLPPVVKNNFTFIMVFLSQDLIWASKSWNKKVF